MVLCALPFSYRMNGSHPSFIENQDNVKISKEWKRKTNQSRPFFYAKELSISVRVLAMKHSQFWFGQHTLPKLSSLQTLFTATPKKNMVSFWFPSTTGLQVPMPFWLSPLHLHVRSFLGSWLISLSLQWATEVLWRPLCQDWENNVLCELMLSWAVDLLPTAMNNTKLGMQSTLGKCLKRPEKHGFGLLNIFLITEMRKFWPLSNFHF